LCAATASADVRVENRALTLEQHLFPRVGFAYAIDGSYYDSPALQVGLSYFFTEHLAADVESSFFFSSLNSAGRAVQGMTGLVPDAAKPDLLLSFGARYAFAYGKMQVNGTDHILRFVPTIAGHFVVKKTDVDWNAGFRVEIAFSIQFHRYLNASFGWAWVGTAEDRPSGSFHGAHIPYIALGSML
jgi:hypothetical protein